MTLPSDHPKRVEFDNATALTDWREITLAELEEKAKKYGDKEYRLLRQSNDVIGGGFEDEIMFDGDKPVFRFTRTGNNKPKIFVRDV